MEQSVSISDSVASHVNRFAAANDVPADHAFELLVSVGLEVLEDRDVDVYVEDEQLILECGACGGLFDSGGAAVDHDCSAGGNA